jgi:hypothetical protein
MEIKENGDDGSDEMDSNPLTVRHKPPADRDPDPMKQLPILRAQSGSCNQVFVSRDANRHGFVTALGRWCPAAGQLASALYPPGHRAQLPSPVSWSPQTASFRKGCLSVILPFLACFLSLSLYFFWPFLYCLSLCMFLSSSSFCPCSPSSCYLFRFFFCASSYLPFFNHFLFLHSFSFFCIFFISFLFFFRKLFFLPYIFISISFSLFLYCFFSY